MADPGFSPGGAPTPKSAIIFQFFAENCMKMKEFGPPGGGARPWCPPWIRQCSIKSAWNRGRYENTNTTKNACSLIFGARNIQVFKETRIFQVSQRENDHKQ